MLTPPTSGFAVSVREHNVRLDAMAEWLEGCITFVDTEVSKSDVNDVLREQNHYRSQDFAQERIDDTWRELERRKRCLGPVCPFDIKSTRLVRSLAWADCSAYAFCLMLALQVAYRGAFTKQFGKNHTQEGELFERLTTESLQQLGWRAHWTGWSKTRANSISDKVQALSTELGEPFLDGATQKWTSANAKDGGLDVVCHLPFADGWAGRPLCFVQCASGENWKEKRHTPDTELWRKLIDLATQPTRGIAHPFVLLPDEFRRAALYEKLSLVLDRHRISQPRSGVKRSWVSTSLANDLNGWTRSRLQALMTYRTN